MSKRSRKEFFYHSFIKSRVPGTLRRTLLFRFNNMLTMLPLNQITCSLDFLETLFQVTLTISFNIFDFCYISCATIFYVLHMLGT